jgi:hypothetical protein
MGWGSLIEVGLNGLHEVEADFIELGNILNAALVDSAGADVGSGSGKTNAEGPAGLGDFLSAFVSTLLELVLTSTVSLALLVFVRTLFLDALGQFLGLGKSQGEDEAEGDNDLHCFGNKM